MKKIFFVIISALLIADAFPQSSDIRFENRKKSGYYNITQVGLLMGNRKLSERNYYTTRNLLVSPSVTMINGCMFNEHWAAGVGVGYEIFDHNHFPVFADIRYTLWDNTVSPFFAIKMGHAIGNIRKKHYENLYLDYEYNNVYFRNYGGLMLNPEIGIKAPISEKADVLFTVAYRFQRSRTTISQDFGQRYEWKRSVIISRLSFGVAIMFR